MCNTKLSPVAGAARFLSRRMAEVGKASNATVVTTASPSLLLTILIRDVVLRWSYVELSRRLRWADTDATGRLHFPRIFEIIEEAESELLRSVGWPVGIRESEYDLPRVHIDCRFSRMIMHDTPFRL